MKQRELNLLTEAQVESLIKTDDKLIRQCSDGAMALRMTINNTSLSQDDLALNSKTNKRSISRALGGSCGLDVDSLIRIMGESNSVFLAQYICQQLGGKFVFLSKEDREIIKAEETLDQLRRRA